ncbi:hypothetical protein [Rathayibacter sp. AY1E1]|uniref:hypothetical protein n=1 Tax=Rathayibacter sp. AY1E1 TaxID=2080549 RepID=UPI000CE8E4D7|nr:hypothetical protein [Rathayibacter sp. AY1E1]PPH51213.1 hypothetical protein C5C67_11905 [Rathayibacter sp. AY1E1]
MTNAATTTTAPARSTPLLTSAQALHVGDIVSEQKETSPGGTVYSTPGGTVAAVDADGPIVAIRYEDGTELVVSALLRVAIIRPWSAA